MFTSRIHFFVCLFLAFFSASFCRSAFDRTEGAAVHPSDPCTDICMDYYYCMNMYENERDCAWKKKDCVCNRG
ncbi:hypothetical protein QR680_007657 [Steinernema hermaphroditum]|uniref:Uncharacterized protein n=1 Tax=Steinernema hermaphroditum TaxID=289476 RepID=A0AA39IG25_9BILA|nr:hypothetical protein QR680_007657 [Steinernema hermaphroditum]